MPALTSRWEAPRPVSSSRPRKARSSPGTRLSGRRPSRRRSRPRRHLQGSLRSPGAGCTRPTSTTAASTSSTAASRYVPLPGGVRRSGAPSGFAPFGIQDDRRQHLRHLREAGRRRRGRGRRPGPRLRRRVRHQRRPARRIATRGQLNAPWGLALAPERLRPLQRRPPRRQLRRRRDQRVRREPTGPTSVSGDLSGSESQADPDRRPVGASVRHGPRTTDRPTRSSSPPGPTTSRTGCSGGSRPADFQSRCGPESDTAPARSLTLSRRKAGVFGNA